MDSLQGSTNAGHLFDCLLATNRLQLRRLLQILIPCVSAQDVSHVLQVAVQNGAHMTNDTQRSPWQLVSLDLLSIIFECLDDISKLTLVERVCRRWRSVG